MPDIQTRMQQILDRAVNAGRERGLQLAVYHNGKLIVDACAGIADLATGRKVDRDTLFPVFSVTKGIAATLAHILVERGLLSYDIPLSEVWPEFAAEGKAATTLRQALSHAAGLPGMPVGIGYCELADWKTMCRIMAAQRPEWPAGTKMIYHAVTFSWLVGEPLCRVTGRPFCQLLADEICHPLGICNDLFCSIPNQVEARVAILDEVFATPPLMPDDAMPQPIPGWIQPLHTMMNRPDARRACIPASSGIMTARALARHYAALLPGGVDGVELLPPDRISKATQLQKPTTWRAGDPAWPMSLGYFIDDGGNLGSPSAFGHGGYGGSIGFGDPHHRIAVGLTKNLFSPNAAQSEILHELRQALIPA